MKNNRLTNYISNLLPNIPDAWLSLTTHRLDIYQEALAKTEFLDQFNTLYEAAKYTELDRLPTAYDYIRLGHPLSCVLEWAIAKSSALNPEDVICFSSQTIAIMAILRKNLLEQINTRIVHIGPLPSCFDTESLHRIYGYQFETLSVENTAQITSFDGVNIMVTYQEDLSQFEECPPIDFQINYKEGFGSILRMYSEASKTYVSDIQHVRRRETIAMTPINCLTVLRQWVELQTTDNDQTNRAHNQAHVEQTLKNITHTQPSPLIASSGLSIQFAIMMGLIEEAVVNYPGKSIQFIVPTNCYGGTNDQARRVAACIDNVSIVDLAVDGGEDMVSSLEPVLQQAANLDAVPYIIAEIPTNPRVEVPDLELLRAALAKQRLNTQGQAAVPPVFILDQTFCPNINFLGQGAMLSSVKSIAYASGSKFPSAGKCTAGYCVANDKAGCLMPNIDKHLRLCDNQATHQQMAILSQQLPSMLKRIEGAYINTQKFVDFIQETLPQAKINFVSEKLAKQGFTPSVFSMDLPTKGNTEKEREAYKRSLNLKLIHKMIDTIPNESKFCVSYGQPKGCYWTVPATSTQGTTKEGDKDYIVRVSVSPDLDFEKHQQVFLDFVASL
jgi:cystathionine beta-lyase/cystathionine gamma-synthase